MSVLYGCANAVMSTWVAAGVACLFGDLLGWSDRFMTLARGVLAELRPFYLPSLAFWVGHDLAVAVRQDDAAAVAHALVLLGCGLVAWFAFRNLGGGDRWKRRRRRAAERVRRAGARLTVAPAPSLGGA
jgi:hypothetical protein